MYKLGIHIILLDLMPLHGQYNYKLLKKPDCGCSHEKKDDAVDLMT